jgi:release factor glutamine methyltransferase
VRTMNESTSPKKHVDMRTTSESSVHEAQPNHTVPPARHWGTVSEALLWGNSALGAAGVPSPRLDAEVLLAHVLGWNRARLYARPEHTLTQAQQEAFLTAVQRRTCHEPVPYIVGHREFYRLDFLVDRRVLIPRPETELLVEEALDEAVRQELGKGWPLLADVGTGSGIVAVALAVNLPRATVYATDTSPDALIVAAANAERHGVASRVHLLLGDLLRPLPERVHIIAANLPYVPAGRLPTLAPDVVEYEPLTALDGGPDGLQPARRLLAQAGEWLLPEGTLVMEIGAEQGPEIVALGRQHYPQARVELLPDHAGLDRVVCIHT